MKNYLKKANLITISAIFLIVVSFLFLFIFK